MELGWLDKYLTNAQKNILNKMIFLFLKFVNMNGRKKTNEIMAY